MAERRQKDFLKYQDGPRRNAIEKLQKKGMKKKLKEN